MATFDTAIPELIEIAEGFAGFVAKVEWACVVRDLRGRVRLVVDGPEPLDLDALAAEIGARLAGWFNGPILHANAGTAAERRLAGEILERSAGWPSGWSKTRKDVTGAEISIGTKWIGYQRVLSKQAWLDSSGEGVWSPAEVWPLAAGNPAIVAFYSFKGGVGRSTLLGVVAWQLAKAGKKVVCLDLDLEAPGLAGLLEASTDESLIDHLLAHAAIGTLPVADPVTEVKAHGVAIGLVPAGRMERSYIEKLARLDYLVPIPKCLKRP